MMTMTTTASGAVVGRANACGAMGSMRASRGRWTVARGVDSRVLVFKKRARGRGGERDRVRGESASRDAR